MLSGISHTQPRACKHTRIPFIQLRSHMTHTHTHGGTNTNKDIWLNTQDPDNQTLCKSARSPFFFPAQTQISKCGAPLWMLIKPAACIRSHNHLYVLTFRVKPPERTDAADVSLKVQHVFRFSLCGLMAGVRVPAGVMKPPLMKGQEKNQTHPGPETRRVDRGRAGGREGGPVTILLIT